MIRRVLLTPRKEERDWKRSSLFHTNCTVQGKVCKMIN